MPHDDNDFGWPGLPVLVLRHVLNYTRSFMDLTSSLPGYPSRCPGVISSLGQETSGFPLAHKVLIILITKGFLRPPIRHPEWKMKMEIMAMPLFSGNKSLNYGKGCSLGLCGR